MYVVICTAKTFYLLMTIRFEPSDFDWTGTEGTAPPPDMSMQCGWHERGERIQTK